MDKNDIKMILSDYLLDAQDPVNDIKFFAKSLLELYMLYQPREETVIKNCIKTILVDFKL